MPGDEVNPGIGEEFLVLRRDLGRELGTAQDRVGCDEADLAALLNEGGGELGAGVGGGGEIGLAPRELGVGPQLLAEGRPGYGESTSALRMAIDPSLSISRMPWAAESAAIPPPMMRYWYVVMCAPKVGFIVETMRTQTTLISPQRPFEGSRLAFAPGQDAGGRSVSEPIDCHLG